MNNSNFILQTAHPLIKSEQTYVLDRKLISIHSVDRDYKKWPNSSEFGIDLGENFYNVQSMRLINFAIPVNHYTFSDSYQNTKLSFTYSVNYPIYLTNFDNNPSSTTQNSYLLLYQILEALFGTYASGFPNKPNDITFERYDSGLGWLVISDADIESYSTATGGAGHSGKYRIVWTPSKDFTITIPEGSYSPSNLAQTIENLMNEQIYNASSLSGFPSADGGSFDFLPGQSTGSISSTDISGVRISTGETVGTTESLWTGGTGIKPFIIRYNDVTNKILFGSTVGTFTLKCGKQETYKSSCDRNKAVYNQYTKWGLAAYLGFQKKDYIATATNLSANTNGVGNPYQTNQGGGTQGLTLYHETTPWLTCNARSLDISGTQQTAATEPDWANITAEIKDGNTTTDSSAIDILISSISADYNLDVHGEDALYMQIDKYNNIDEMYPYSERTGNLYNNDLGHRSNGSFARIPLTHLPFGQELGSRNNFVLNVFHTDPPIKKIDRLKFTFRYHDGRLVDFKNLPFSFTLEFNMLKDEQVLGRSVRVPTLYNL